ncbi:META domain-containing protein [Streptomyces sp. HUAS MG47]|uniref:META domain-containing protein n=1 Tax=Streptomyces solicamelliae TaxID=3231716 RepID=UPI00387806EE
MQKPRITAVAALASLVLLAACGTESGTGAGSGTVDADVFVANVRWTFDTITADGKKTTAPAGAYVEFTENGRAAGNSGCNHFGGAATVEDDTVTVSLGETTEMGCDAERQSFEKLLHRTFDGRLKAVVDGDTLTLTRPDGDTLVLSSQPPAPLKGTKWTVDTLVSGETASSLPAGTEGRAHFVIGADGRVAGNLGCNRFSTTATVSGSTISFGRVVSTRMVCAPPQMTVEKAMLKVFESRDATYALHVRQLTLTTPDGSGVAASATRVVKD